MSTFKERFFKESEHEKLGNELLNKLIPMDVLNSYYKWGYTQALIDVNKYVKQITDDDNIMTELVKMLLENDTEIKSYYKRLTKIKE